MSAVTLGHWRHLAERLDAVSERFYRYVFADAVLGPLFADQGPQHPARLAAYLRHEFFGDAAYPRRRGDLQFMINQHRGRNFTDAQRGRWVALMLRSLREEGCERELLDNLRRYFQVTAGLAQKESRDPVRADIPEAPGDFPSTAPGEGPQG